MVESKKEHKCKREIKIKAYDIVTVDFGDVPIGSEQGGIRPAVVIQNNIGNYYSPTTIVLPLTSQKKSLKQPTHVLLKSEFISALTEDSIVLGEAVRQVDKSRILEYRGKITDKKYKQQIYNAYICNIEGVSE